MSRLGALAALIVLAGVVAGCGGGGDAHRIGFLVPGNQSHEIEARVRREFEGQVEEHCGECKVLFATANGNASKQQEQAKEALGRGAEALVVEPVDPASMTAIAKSAKANDVPVVAIGRLLSGTHADFQVAFSEYGVGQLQAKSLSRALELNGSANGPIVLINDGSPDSAARLVKQGAIDGYIESDVTVTKAYNTLGRSSSEAKEAMKSAITAIGEHGFEGVSAASDRLAGGAIEAMESAGIDPREKPTVGVGATLAGVQRVLGGSQYMTAYSPTQLEAATGAEIAADLVEGNEVSADILEQEANGGQAGAHSILLEPVAVTRDNVKQTVVADGFISPSELCAKPYAKACEAAGISPEG